MTVALLPTRVLQDLLNHFEFRSGCEKSTSKRLEYLEGLSDIRQELKRRSDEEKSRTMFVDARRRAG